VIQGRRGSNGCALRAMWELLCFSPYSSRQSLTPASNAESGCYAIWSCFLFVGGLQLGDDPRRRAARPQFRQTRLHDNGKCLDVWRRFRGDVVRGNSVAGRRQRLGMVDSGVHAFCSLWLRSPAVCVIRRATVNTKPKWTPQFNAKAFLLGQRGQRTPH
jgi:hypothetical protein